VRICAAEAAPPAVVWSEAFEIQPGQYNAVAYIENKNERAAADALRYTFRLYHEATVLAERSGITNLPPNSTYPVFEGRIFTNSEQPVTRTEITLEPIPYWWPATIGRNQFRTVNTVLRSADNQPRLEVKLENVLIPDARDVEVVATIFDAGGNPLTASQTFRDVIPGRSTQDIVFTWPNPISQTIRSCEVPTDVLLAIDRSGSMAADGGNPPEPLESAKRAAETFVRQLREQDQIAVLSYATTPSNPLEQVLAPGVLAGVAAIGQVRMGTDGIQYTDMAAALRAAAAELRGPRQRDDARKVLILMTDGDVTRPVNPATGERDIAYATNAALQAAADARAVGIIIYSIGFGAEFGSLGTDIDRNLDLVRQLATDETKSFVAPTVADLTRVYQEIGRTFCEVGGRIDVIAKTNTNFQTE
jgi:Mg-chelatase subunit ChlD